MLSDAVKNIKKKVVLQLVGLDSNAFSIMGAFKQAARRQGWTRDEIEAVLEDCRSGDYDHLLYVMMEVTVPTEADLPLEQQEEEEEGAILAEEERKSTAQRLHDQPPKKTARGSKKERA